MELSDQVDPAAYKGVPAESWHGEDPCGGSAGAPTLMAGLRVALDTNVLVVSGLVLSWRAFPAAS